VRAGLLAGEHEPQIKSKASVTGLRFNSSPTVIRVGLMMYGRFPLSLRNVEVLLFEREIKIRHETVQHWWNRLGPMLAGDIRRKRVSRIGILTLAATSRRDVREAR
jgi:transposase-like protein